MSNKLVEEEEGSEVDDLKEEEYAVGVVDVAVEEEVK